MTNESLMRRYLLGDLPAEERTRVEDEYFADADRFEEVVGLENDLIDSYVRGTLSDSERQQFEQHYAKRPERRARIDLAKALSQAAQPQRESITSNKASPWRSFLSYCQIPRPQLQWALASAAVLLVGAVLGLQNYRLRTELQEAQASANQLRRQQDHLREQIAELGSHRQQAESEQGSQVARLEPPADLIYRLVPGVLRGTVSQENLILPQNRPWVRLEMALDRDDYTIYQAALLTAEGREVLRGKPLKSLSAGGNAVVEWRLPSHSIRSGDYIVRLTGETETGSLEDVESYNFRAVRK